MGSRDSASWVADSDSDDRASSRRIADTGVLCSGSGTIEARSCRRAWCTFAAAYGIEINDLYDLAALGLAVSSCDVVATDGSARAMLVAAAMDKRHNCQLLSRPIELLELIKSLEQAAAANEH